MLNREACERRVYRLATLLTGDPISATDVITAVVGAQPDLRKLDSAHLDRLTVLRSREVTPKALDHPQIPKSIAISFAALSTQQREAWVLARVYRVPKRELSRAMDCSLTATERHLEMADGAMKIATDGKISAAAHVLLQYTQSLDVPAFYRAKQRRRRLVRRVCWGLGLVMLLAAIITVAVLWSAA